MQTEPIVGFLRLLFYRAHDDNGPWLSLYLPEHFPRSRNVNDILSQGLGSNLLAESKGRCWR